MQERQTVEDAFKRIVPQIQGFKTALTMAEVEITEEQIKFIFPNKILKEQVARDYISKLGIKLIEENIKVGFICSVSDTVKQHGNKGDADNNGLLPGFSAPPVKKNEKCIPKKNQEPKQNLNPYFTFQNFVVGDTNRVAHDAVLSLANWPSNPHELSPMLITGGTSSGKTHLLNAAAWLALGKRQNAKVKYVTANGLFHHFVDCQLSDENGKKEQFRKLYHTADFLIVDDIHFLVGKDKTVIEFRTICDSIMNSGGILLMSSVPTSEALQLRAEVQSRVSCMQVEIREPDFDLRVAIVIKKAELYGVQLSDNLPLMIAERLGPDIRKLEGGIKLIKFHFEKYHKDINERLLNELFGTETSAREGLKIAEILSAVAEHLDISEKVFTSSSHRAEEVYARDLAVHLCVKLLGSKVSDLMRAFNRDRTWPEQALKRAKKKLVDDPNHFGKDVEVLTTILTNS